MKTFKLCSAQLNIKIRVWKMAGTVLLVLGNRIFEKPGERNN